MRLLTRYLTFSLRNVRSRRSGGTEQTEKAEPREKIKFTEDQITEMGQYRMKPKSRNVKDIFQDKYEEKKTKEYLKNQKEDMLSFTDDIDELFPEDPEATTTPKKKSRMTKQQKQQHLRTFKIYKHVDRLRRLKQQKLSSAKGKDLITDQLRLKQLSKVRLLQQYLPYEYMKNVQKVFHKYDQTQLRDIAFHFTNLMKMRYSQQKIDYEQYQGLQFQRLQEKMPYHRRVEQIYLTSKEKALQQRDDSMKRTQKTPEQAQIKYSQNMIISYLLNRVPRTYAVAYRTLTQIKRMFDTFTPKSFIDFGAGLSSGSAAFAQLFGQTGSIYSVQPVGKMRKLAKYLTQYSSIAHFQSLAELSSQVKQVDIVYCGYVLNELKPQLIEVYLQALYAKVKPQGFMIVTEHGNPFGARLIHQTRRWALNKKIRIAAPCPHQYKCPLSSSKKWCHFDQPTGMFPRQVFGKLPSENSIKLEKFSYLIIQKLEEEQTENDPIAAIPTNTVEPNESKEWDRVLFPLMRRGGHFLFNLCSKSGKFEKRITSRSHGYEYREGKKLHWGDFWRFGFRIPNRYRKERKTGKRLW